MRRSFGGNAIVTGMAAAILVLAIACSPIERGDEPVDAPPPTAPAATPTPDTPTSGPATVPQPGPLTTAELVDVVQDSVVRVSIPGGVGSGFVIDPDGFIITNYHVIETGLNNVDVTLSDGAVLQAEVVGTDPQSDLAVLRVDAGRPLPPLELAELRDVMVGEDVVAIGFALDLAEGAGPPSVTRGIVSAKNRAIASRLPAILGAVQTDAAINRGNSGGPLLNYRGQVVGVNTALAPDREGGVAQNIGFAVGADTVRAVYDEIREKGRVDRALLGIQSFNSIRPAEARALGLPEDTRGILLRDGSVLPDGPAGSAGLLAQDVIVSVGGQQVEDESELAVAMIVYDPGETVTLAVYREGTLIDVEVTLGSA